MNDDFEEQHYENKKGWNNCVLAVQSVRHGNMGGNGKTANFSIQLS